MNILNTQHYGAKVTV